MELEYGYQYLMLVKKDWIDWWFDDETYNVKELVMHNLKTEGKMTYDIYDMMSGGWPGYLPKRFVAECDHDLFEAISKYQKESERYKGVPDEDEIHFYHSIKNVDVLDDYFQVLIEIDYK